MKDSLLFKYKAKNCTNVDDVQTALKYYESIKETIPNTKMNNFIEVIAALNRKLEKFGIYEIEAEEIEKSLSKDRLYFYHKSIRLSTELLLLTPNSKRLEELYECIKQALLLVDITWDENIHYTDLVRFDNAFTRKEKIVYFIHKILISGFHTNKSLLSIMNLYIKLLRILDLSKDLRVTLPSKKILHDISFELQEYKY